MIGELFLVGLEHVTLQQKPDFSRDYSLCVSMSIGQIRRIDLKISVQLSDKARFSDCLYGIPSASLDS